MIAHIDKESVFRELETVLEHPGLSVYFSEDTIVLNERDIISDGVIYRPDRVTIDGSKFATVIDYKTGEHSASHVKQLEAYGLLLKKMGYEVKEMILVYFNDELTLKYV